MSKDKGITSANTSTSIENLQNPLVLPDKVTLGWLVHHVPLTFWFWLVGIVIVTFTIGVTVGQTTFIKELLGKKTEASQSQNSPSQETKDSPKNNSSNKGDPELKMSEPTPLQINEEIEKVPPLQRQDVVRRYEGIKVDWELIFSSARQGNKDLAVVILDSSPEKLNPLSVRCVVKLSDHKELSIMRPGKKVRVTGTISNIEPMLYVELKDVQLTYLN